MGSEIYDAQQKIEIYLGKLRGRLRGMNEGDVREIVEELRAHITDKTAANGVLTPAAVDGALSALGTPDELASQYLTDALLARAEITRSPVRILDGLFRWASLSVQGFFVLMCSIAGYFFGVVFLLCALLKPLHPQTAGLWAIPDGPNHYAMSLRLGFIGTPVAAREVLGLWIIPIGLVVGCGLVVLTTCFALWCVRHYRTSHVLP
jgi:uncharacterized membrane protein